MSIHYVVHFPPGFCEIGGRLTRCVELAHVLLKAMERHGKLTFPLTIAKGFHVTESQWLELTDTGKWRVERL